MVHCSGVATLYILHSRQSADIAGVNENLMRLQMEMHVPPRALHSSLLISKEIGMTGYIGYCRYCTTLYCKIIMVHAVTYNGTFTSVVLYYTSSGVWASVGT